MAALAGSEINNGPPPSVGRHGPDRGEAVGGSTRSDRYRAFGGWPLPHNRKMPCTAGELGDDARGLPVEMRGYLVRF